MRRQSHGASGTTLNSCIDGRTKDYGEAVLLAFDLPAAVRAWHERQGRPSGRGPSERDDDFMSIVEGVDLGVKEYSDRLEVPVAEGLREAKEEFNDYLATLRDLSGNESIATDMQLTLPLGGRKEAFEDVVIGDSYRLAGDLAVNVSYSGPDASVDELDSPSTATAFFNSENNLSLSGTLTRFCGTWFNVPGKGQSKEFALAAVLSNPSLMVDVTGEETPYKSGVIMVRLDDATIKNAYRMIYKNNP